MHVQCTVLYFCVCMYYVFMLLFGHHCRSFVIDRLLFFVAGCCVSEVAVSVADFVGIDYRSLLLVVDCCMPVVGHWLLIVCGCCR
jgi:hypothetical protein